MIRQTKDVSQETFCSPSNLVSKHIKQVARATANFAWQLFAGCCHLANLMA